jgi:NAD(P)-dependent dehydrogenase (short-subunit alcohol dehydrogenase family)
MTSKAKRVSVVTGASRGVGKGVALALGGKGDTVYVTGRTLTGENNSLEATVEEINRRGGKGMAVVCDHRDDEQTEAVFERVKQDQGCLDILVNNAFIIHQDLVSGKHFWEKPLSVWDMIDVGLRSSYIASVFAAKMMVEQRSGLIANISAFGGGKYRHDVVYGVGKAGTDRLAVDMAEELRPHNVASVSLWLGMVATEVTLKAFRNPGEGFTQFKLDDGESPEFPGLIIDALANDAQLMQRTGKVLISAELGLEYGVKDIDGHQPESLRQKLGSPVWND